MAAPTPHQVPIPTQVPPSPEQVLAPVPKKVHQPIIELIIELDLLALLLLGDDLVDWIVAADAEIVRTKLG